MRINYSYLCLVVSFSCSVALCAEQSAVDDNYDELVKQMCAKNTAPVTRTSGTKVYSWTDDSGQVYFGDRPPTTVSATVETLQGKKDYFDMEVSFPAGGIANSGISDALQVNGRAIVYAMSHLIPSERITKTHLDMKIFTNKSSFQAYRRQKTNNLSNPISGFYIPLENAIAVWHDGDDLYAQQVALHEATHAFQSKNLGVIPGWLAEGMAEYFENMTVEGNAKTVQVSRYWVQYFQSNHSYIPLSRLLTSDYRAWKGPQAASYYGNAWAFVYFMMLPENRSLMGEYLAHVSKDKCDEPPVNDSIVFFEKNYPGGMRRLQNNWLSWLASPAQVANYH